jgi:L-glyceraldehyde 3-phosphate reductase
MWALDSIVKSGKALYVGLSNYDGARMCEAAKILNELHCPFVINQNRYSILDRTPEKNGIFDAATAEKKGMIIFSPLAQGLLTGRYLNGIPEDSRVRTDGRFLKESSITNEVLAKIRKLNKIAENRGQSLAQMALSWVYSREGVTSVLIGASKPEQIIENLKMTKNTAFTKNELDEIDSIALKVL